MEVIFLPESSPQEGEQVARECQLTYNRCTLSILFEQQGEVILVRTKYPLIPKQSAASHPPYRRADQLRLGLPCSIQTSIPHTQENNR